MNFCDELQKCRSNHILRLLSEEKFSDVTFIVGQENEKVLHGCRCLLSLISPVFEAMLYGQMKESASNAVIKIPDINPEAFQSILRYSYGIDPQIDEKNCVLVRDAAEKYQITSLSPFIDNYILSCLNEEKFCSIYHGACLTRHPELMAKCIGKLETFVNFDVVLSSKGFLDLSPEPDMKLLLDSDLFQVHEEVLWERLLDWAEWQMQLEATQHSISKRGEFLALVKDSVRFPLMSPCFLVEKVAPEEVLDSSEFAAVLSDAVVPSDKPRSSYNSLGRLAISCRLPIWQVEDVRLVHCNRACRPYTIKLVASRDVYLVGVGFWTSVGHEQDVALSIACLDCTEATSQDMESVLPVEHASYNRRSSNSMRDQVHND